MGKGGNGRRRPTIDDGAGGREPAATLRPGAESSHWPQPAATVIGAPGVGATSGMSRGSLEGELRVAAALATLAAGFVVLHDLHVPGSDANVDHLVLGWRGVWLIETAEVNGHSRWRRGRQRRDGAALAPDLDRLRAHGGAVSTVLRVPVAPLLCQTEPGRGPGATARRRKSRRPSPRPGPGEVAVVDLDHLVAFLRTSYVPGTSTVGEPVEMDSLVRLARTLRTPTPTPTPTQTATPSPNPAPTPGFTPGSTHSGPGVTAAFTSPAPLGEAVVLGTPAVTPRLRTRRGLPGRRRASSLALRSPALTFPARVVAVSLATVLAAAMLPHYLQDAGTAFAGLVGPRAVTTTTVAMPPLDGPIVARPSPPFGLGLTCPIPGAGWQAQVLWPSVADPSDAPAAIEVSSGPPDLQPRLWLRGAGAPPTVTGLNPGTEVVVTALALMADGTRLAPQRLTRTTPSQPC